MKPRYMLHPGIVRSRHDNDRHFIDAGELARLYCLKPGEYFVWNETHCRGCRLDDFIHLYPSYEGKYGRPAV
jgi:hypothetical protein